MSEESKPTTGSGPERLPREKMGLVLPLTKDEFGQFISSLLGKPQTIEKSFLGTFAITREDIENTFLLVDQRVNQQNEASLVQFTIKIVYHDNSAVTLNGIEDFKHFREITPLVSVAAHLSWTYLIKFQDKDTPEKQQIEMSIGTSPPWTSVVIDSDDIRVFHAAHYFFEGDIQIRISHTARTWGVDIESLLTGHIKTFMKKQSWLKRKVCEYNWLFGLVLAVLFFLVAVAGAFVSTNHVIQERQAHVEPFVAHGTADMKALGERVDFLIQDAARGTWARHFFLLSGFLLLFLILAIIAGVVGASFADNKPCSFLLLTDKAAEARDKWIQSQKKSWRNLILAMPVSIVCSFLGSLLFAIIVRKGIN